jgi:hypothetical protein
LIFLIFFKGDEVEKFSKVVEDHFSCCHVVKRPESESSDRMVLKVKDNHVDCANEEDQQVEVEEKTPVGWPNFRLHAWNQKPKDYSRGVHYV